MATFFIHFSFSKLSTIHQGEFLGICFVNKKVSKGDDKVFSYVYRNNYKDN